jgi:hypothetical protein
MLMAAQGLLNLEASSWPVRESQARTECLDARRASTRIASSTAAAAGTTSPFAALLCCHHAASGKPGACIENTQRIRSGPPTKRGDLRPPGCCRLLGLPARPRFSCVARRADQQPRLSVLSVNRPAHVPDLGAKMGAAIRHWLRSNAVKRGDPDWSIPVDVRKRPRAVVLLA